MRLTKSLILVFLLFTTGSEVCYGRSTVQSTDWPRVKAIAKNTETFYFVDYSSIKDASAIEEMLTIPIAPLMMAFERIGFSKKLVRDRIECVVMGAKEFRRPSGLGLTTFQGVYLAKFRKPIAPNLDSLLCSSFKSLSGGFKSCRFEVPDQDAKKPWEFYVVQVSDVEILISTDFVLLQAIWDSNPNPDMDEALHNEWKEVPASASVWAVRRYSHSRPADPIGSGIQLTQNLSVKAKALTFFYDEENRRAVMRIQTTSSDGFMQFWRLLPEVKVIHIKSGLWQVSFSIRDETLLSYEYMTFLHRMFGFGIFL